MTEFFDSQCSSCCHILSVFLLTSNHGKIKYSLSGALCYRACEASLTVGEITYTVVSRWMDGWMDAAAQNGPAASIDAQVFAERE